MVIQDIDASLPPTPQHPSQDDVQEKKNPPEVDGQKVKTVQNINELGLSLSPTKDPQQDLEQNSPISSEVTSQKSEGIDCKQEMQQSEEIAKTHKSEVTAQSDSQEQNTTTSEETQQSEEIAKTQKSEVTAHKSHSQSQEKNTTSQEAKHNNAKTQKSEVTTPRSDSQEHITKTPPKTQQSEDTQPSRKQNKKKERKRKPKETIPKQKNDIDFSFVLKAVMSFVLKVVKFKHRPNLLALVAASFFMLPLVQVVASQPLTVDFGNQSLTPGCMEEYTLGCPHFDQEYETANEKCCKHIEGAVLHCLDSHYDSEREKHVLSVSCMPDSTVPAGNSLNITARNGLPHKDILPCPPGHFEPEDRKSSKIRLPYCETKTQCNAENNEQTFCDGGTTRDDKCICSPGFEPQYWKTPNSHCRRGFDSNDVCLCEKASCPHGTARNISYSNGGKCPDTMVTIGYACSINVSSIDLTTPPANVTSGCNTTHKTPLELSFGHFLAVILPVCLVLVVPMICLY